MIIEAVIEWIKLFWALTSTMTVIGGVIMWAVLARIKEKFCSKQECEAKHRRLDNDLLLYRSSISNDISEMKAMLKEIRGWVFEYITSKGEK
jgi:uncharacterized membrane-anchored protein YhcB (DUF1043 family)